MVQVWKNDTLFMSKFHGQNLIIGPYLIACKPGDHSLALCLERKERMGLCHNISTSVSVIHLSYNEI